MALTASEPDMDDQDLIDAVVRNYDYIRAVRARGTALPRRPARAVEDYDLADLWADAGNVGPDRPRGQAGTAARAFRDLVGAEARDAIRAVDGVFQRHHPRRVALFAGAPMTCLERIAIMWRQFAVAGVVVGFVLGMKLF